MRADHRPHRQSTLFRPRPAGQQRLLLGAIRPCNISLDPNVPTATPGQSFQTPNTSFTTVPTNLRQQVTVKINAELYSQASAIFGFGPGVTTVLTQSFDASALVGNILTVGNLVSASGGGLDISASTFTYTPFLVIGSGGSDVSQDSLITGTPFQELYTNFPLGNQVLTGLFLEIDALDYSYSPQVYTHTHPLRPPRPRRPTGQCAGDFHSAFASHARSDAIRSHHR